MHRPGRGNAAELTPSAERGTLLDSSRPSPIEFLSCPAMPATRDHLQQTPRQSEGELAQSQELSTRSPEPQNFHVPGFQVVRKLGEGAYGAVWLAREEKTGKEVAVKFYSHHRGLDWSLLSREVEKLALLYTSRHVVRLIDVGWQADPPWYVMEYLERGSLEGLLADGQPHPDEAVRIIRCVCQALVHAHGRGVLHCDLKPANILLDADLEPRLCDFGQSRLSHEQNPALGTLFYMAPEQADLHAIPDARWDVYALGALLFHLLVGHPPHRTPENEDSLRQAQTLEERLQRYRQIAADSPPPNEHWKAAGIDRRLSEIVDRCLHSDPQRRYPNAQAVLDELVARDRQRRVRPLVALGGIGPGLILLAMFFFAANATNSAVDTAGANLTARALESDAMSVSILARSIERELQDRMDELVRVASDRHLVAAIETSQRDGWSDRVTFGSILDGVRDSVDARRKQHDRELDTSWFFVDADGFQRWRSPHDSEIIGQQFNYRDYYHAHGVDYGKGEAPQDVSPIRAPHISLVFESRSTFRNMVALSVPVWGSNGGDVIGVVARTAHVSELLSQYEGSISGAGGVARTIALVDTRNWRLLDHSRLAGLKKGAGQLTLSDEVSHRLSTAGTTSITMTDYRDPLRSIDPQASAGEWLAAFAPVGRTGWTAIVQERKAEVLLPVYELQSRLTRYAWFAFGVAGAIVGLMWYFVLKSVSERGLRLWSQNGHTNGDALIQARSASE